MTMKSKLLVLTGYSLAMALLEAAVVVYMRQLYYPQDPLQLFPLLFLNKYEPILELSRELSTIVMIVTVALLAEQRNWTRRFAAFVFIFGVWDLFYYVWLKVLMDWPQAWLEWDVLFLIPMIWLGPWICPALIAALFIAWGTYGMCTKKDIAFSPMSIAIFVGGALLGLFCFMQPALGLQHEELISYTPGSFAWRLYAVSYTCMATSLFLTTRARSPTDAG